jgi:hypothetical protein
MSHQEKVEWAQGTSSERIQDGAARSWKTRPGIWSMRKSKRGVERADKKHEPAKPRPHDITLTSPIKWCGMSIQWQAASHEE